MGVYGRKEKQTKRSREVGKERVPKVAGTVRNRTNLCDVCVIFRNRAQRRGSNEGS